ncbi:hypothetical protein BDA96_01G215000 [Sorghum bicolor]|uniref:Uncharacterized protein n=1 Tax=Sorghum bicolor TaxID=4558 RepID=A0A921V0V3_SORBI|nr:hypothetical protein BDA96_01G215000 [Sorghum bicolor]
MQVPFLVQFFWDIPWSLPERTYTLITACHRVWCMELQRQIDPKMKFGFCLV